MQICKLISLLTVFTANCLYSCFGASKEGERCIQDSNCNWGLQCEVCFKLRETESHCTRLIPIHPYLQVKGLPFNRYSWLTTHASYANSGPNPASYTGPKIFLQDDSITSQLNNGIRGLMLDVHDYNNDTWLCYGPCSNSTASRLAMDALIEVREFLESNPLEVVTIFLEDNVTSPYKNLTRLFNTSGLEKFRLPITQMPLNGTRDWLSIDTMIKQNQRLVVFTSRPDKEIREGIAYKWNYLVENQYGTRDMMQNSWCLNRQESLPMNTESKALILVNNYEMSPDSGDVCKYNSIFLLHMLRSCSLASGDRWPNFVAINFYKRTAGGGAKAIDMVNGRLICGCNDIYLCKANMKFGDCRPS